jgi:hypothetical protein
LAGYRGVFAVKIVETKRYKCGISRRCPGGVPVSGLAAFNLTLGDRRLGNRTASREEGAGSRNASKRLHRIRKRAGVTESVFLVFLTISR